MAKAKGLSYGKAGVNIREGDAFVERLAKHAPAIGGFAGLFPLKTRGMKQPMLVASTDGVGTKILLARQLGRLDTIGIDLVAMVLNDIAVCGAQPLFFLDYYATGKLSAKEGDAIIRGIVEGCARAGVPLIGGETAEMPGLYRPGDFDLAGFGVGVVDSKDVIDGRRMMPGDAVIGVASSGVHSNGYSLVRAIVKQKRLDLKRNYDIFTEPLGATLLRPTRIYTKAVARVLRAATPTGMAHITGGGIADNVERVVPPGVDLEIGALEWLMPLIFPMLARWGSVSAKEMFNVFNMGIGFVIVCRPKDERAVHAALAKAGERSWTIGRAVKGTGKVRVHDTEWVAGGRRDKG